MSRTKLILYSVVSTCLVIITCGICCAAIDQVATKAGVDTTPAKEAVETGEKAKEAGTDLYEGLKAITDAFKDMDIKTERELGESIALQCYASDNFGYPVRSDEVMKYFNIMANVIAQNSDRPLIPYHIAVVKSDEVNALSTPGGYIFMTSGLIKLLDNEAQLAAVIGHEIAHIAFKHTLKGIKQGKAAEGAGKILKVAAKFTSDSFSNNIGEYANLVTGLASSLRLHDFSSDDEYESDVAGARYAMDTGYNPREMLKVLEKLRFKDKPGDSTHPTADQRIAKVNEFLDEAKKENDFASLITTTDRFPKIKQLIDQAKESDWQK